MTQVTFFLIEGPDAETSIPAQLSWACDIAARCYRQRQRVSVLCDSKASAEQFDEYLWQQPVDGFVPHNLTGEGPANGAPVEICWQPPTQFSRPVLINLCPQVPQFGQRFKQIYDFVPAEDDLKQLARERYKHYRAAGYQLDTRPAGSINES